MTLGISFDEGAPVAQWIKRCLTDLVDRVRSPFEAKSYQPLLEYHFTQPSIVLMRLKYSMIEKDVKSQVIHSSITRFFCITGLWHPKNKSYVFKTRTVPFYPPTERFGDIAMSLVSVRPSVRTPVRKRFFLCPLYKLNTVWNILMIFHSYVKGHDDGRIQK